MEDSRDVFRLPSFLPFLFALRGFHGVRSFDISPQGFDVARSMLVRYKLVLLTRQPDPEKARLFRKSQGNRERDMFVERDIFVVSCIRFLSSIATPATTWSMLIQFESLI